MNPPPQNPREHAAALMNAAAKTGDQTGWFETLYASAAGDPAKIPWGDRRPNPGLVDWLPAHAPSLSPRTAAVIGCGLGDDAQLIAAHFPRADITAFDIAPSAVEWCKARFPDSKVRYEVADLLAPPADYLRRFDFIFEAYTLQVLRGDLRTRAIQSLASLLAPGGTLLLICRAREQADPPGDLPFPLTRDEVLSLQSHGLALQAFDDYLDSESPPKRRFRAVLQRPA